MNQIRNYESFVKIEPIHKGFSSDEKYYIETKEGDKLLLRVADISEYSSKQMEYEMMIEVAAMGITMSIPKDFGTFDNDRKVYSLFSWCDGEDATLVLPGLSETIQYELGVKAGKMLKTIHSIKAPTTVEDWDIRFNRKINTKINKFSECGIRFDGDDKIIQYIEDNRGLLANRPQTFHHGDYHIGNMVIAEGDIDSINNLDSIVRDSRKESSIQVIDKKRMPAKENTLYILDFNRWDYGDPWEEFNRIVWSASVSPYFATGQLHGYFNGKPPMDFFRLMALYISSNTLSSIYWAIPFGDEEVNIMMKQSQEVLSWYNNMDNPIPTWYGGDESNE